MGHCQIVGILLIKDEDIYIERVIRNIIGFCDQIIIAENYSQDRTYEILKALAEDEPKIKLYQVKDVKESHTLIENFAGTDTWILGVDGDEIYDHIGLIRMREQLQHGIFDRQWAVFGNVLHCTHLDLIGKTAKGYLAPPARSMTKLYNFSIIDSWKNCYQRTHGGTIQFKNGYHAELRCMLGEQMSWEDSHFRCLHTAFIKRSSLQQNFLIRSRWNTSEVDLKKKNYIKQFVRTYRFKGNSWVAHILWNSKLLFRNDWKHEQYAKGPLVKKEVSAFFPE